MAVFYFGLDGSVSSIDFFATPFLASMNQRDSDRSCLLKLYLRQPGYGTSYITGKYLLERTLADYSKQVEERGKDFQMKDIFDILNALD